MKQKEKSYKKFYIVLLIITAIMAVLHITSRFFPEVIELVHSRTIYWIISQTISAIFSLFPFSFAEFALIAGVIFIIAFLIYALIKSIINSFKGRKTPFKPLKTWGIAMLCIIMILYSSFVLLCGLNYNRQTFAKTANLEIKESSVEELSELCIYLSEKASRLREMVNTDADGVMTYKNGESVFAAMSRAKKGFDNAGQKYSCLKGFYSSPKPILFSNALSYTFTSGIFIPFTVEANVNTAQPAPELLHTAMHEMAHQRGFAREDEANYIGYLACKSHPDLDYQYSGYFEALTYSMNALYDYDPDKYWEIRENFNEGIEKDMQAIKNFWKQYESPMQEVAETVNNTYLKANNQGDGVHSYGRFVNLLLAEYRARQEAQSLQ